MNIQPYTGKCEHKNITGDDMGYGFAGFWSCKGLGIYTECPDCNAKEYTPDMECVLPDEEEWYKNSPWSKGWVTITENKED